MSEYNYRHDLDIEDRLDLLFECVQDMNEAIQSLQEEIDTIVEHIDSQE